uniref:Glycoprotein hormone subunit beta domain-containing protein n=1 Tax=Varanus komodoensis TaxID=61221 RepID=A0A8D2IZM6_VARKO
WGREQMGKNLLLAACLLLALTHCASRRNGPRGSSSSLACHPVNATIAAEKEDCPVCMAITTSICSGYCETRVCTILSSFNQRVCTYKDVRYETMLLRGCPAGVDPSFTYPVALSCHCDLCKMDSSDCTQVPFARSPTHPHPKAHNSSKLTSPFENARIPSHKSFTKLTEVRLLIQWQPQILSSPSS